MRFYKRLANGKRREIHFVLLWRSHKVLPAQVGFAFYSTIALNVKVIVAAIQMRLIWVGERVVEL